MRRLAALVTLVVPVAALANADGPPRAEPEDRIQGPFATLGDYCASRGERDCATDSIDAAPSVAAGAAIRAYRFVRIGSSVHVVVQTSSGWSGRAIGAASNGDGATVDTVRLADIARGPEAELVFDLSTYHDPCACDDLYHARTLTFVCTVDGGALACSDGIETAEDMHLVDIWSYSSTLSFERRGRDLRVKRAITSPRGMRRSTLRTLAAPFAVTLHR